MFSYRASSAAKATSFEQYPGDYAQFQQDVTTVLKQYQNKFGDCDLDLTEHVQTDDIVKKMRTHVEPEDLVRNLFNLTERGIWLSFSGTDDMERFLVPALKVGFTIHQGRDGFVRLRGWPHTSEDPAPPYSFTWLVTGAVVVNAEKEVLMIQQSYDEHSMWRPPGGCVDPHETVVDAAIRETKEETGVEVEFVCTLGYFEAPERKSIFGKGAFGVLSLFRPKYDRQSLDLQESEISACRWYPLEDCLTDDFRLPSRMIPFFKYAKMLVDNTDLFDKDSKPTSTDGKIQESMKLCSREDSNHLGILPKTEKDLMSLAQLKTSSGYEDVDIKPPMYVTLPVAVTSENSGSHVFDPTTDTVPVSSGMAKSITKKAGDISLSCSIPSWALYCGIFTTCAVLIGYTFSR